jgi:hypothetical protein
MMMVVLEVMTFGWMMVIVPKLLCDEPRQDTCSRHQQQPHRTPKDFLTNSGWSDSFY